MEPSPQQRLDTVQSGVQTKDHHRVRVVSQGSWLAGWYVVIISHLQLTLHTLPIGRMGLSGEDVDG